MDAPRGQRIFHLVENLFSFDPSPRSIKAFTYGKPKARTIIHHFDFFNGLYALMIIALTGFCG
jgi:hypothetical protein